MIAVDEKEEEVGGDSSNDGPKVQVLVHKQRRDREREIANKRRLELGLRNGMLQVLRTLLDFLNTNVMIEYWHVGNRREKIPPFAFLDAKYVRHIRSRKMKLGHMKCVIQVSERIAMMEGIYNNREGLDLAYTKLLWERFGKKICQ